MKSSFKSNNKIMLVCCCCHMVAIFYLSTTFSRLSRNKNNVFILNYKFVFINIVRRMNESEKCVHGCLDCLNLSSNLIPFTGSTTTEVVQQTTISILFTRRGLHNKYHLCRWWQRNNAIERRRRKKNECFKRKKEIVNAIGHSIRPN